MCVLSNLFIVNYLRNISVVHLFFLSSSFIKLFLPHIKKENTMKTKTFSSLLISFALLAVNTPAMSAKNCTNQSVQEIVLSANDIPFSNSSSSGGGPRSVIFDIPIYAYLSVENHFVQLSFSRSVGAITIVISQNGIPVYSSSENIVSACQKGIQLPADLSGDFLLEIKGNNGAYAYGDFDL